MRLLKSFLLLYFLCITTFLNAVSISSEVLDVSTVDSNSNGKIDRVDIKVSFINSYYKATNLALESSNTLDNFEITDIVTMSKIDIKSINFKESVLGESATFSLFLDEDLVSFNTSKSSINVKYVDKESSGLFIYSLVEDTRVESFSLIESDLAAPVATISTNSIQNSDEVYIHFSEFIDTSTIMSQGKPINFDLALVNSLGDSINSGRVLKINNSTINYDLESNIFTIKLNSELDNSYFEENKILLLSFKDRGIRDLSGNYLVDKNIYSEPIVVEKELVKVDMTAKRVGSSSLEIYFDESVKESLAEDIENYIVTSNQNVVLTPVSATLKNDKRTLLLEIAGLSTIEAIDFIVDVKVSILIEDLYGNYLDIENSKASYISSEKSLTYSTNKIDITVSKYNFLASSIDIELLGEKFIKSGVLISDIDYSIEGLPSYLRSNIEIISPTSAKLTIIESSKSSLDSSHNIELNFLDSVFETKYSENILNSKYNISLEYINAIAALDDLIGGVWQQISMPNGVRTTSDNLMKSGLVASIWEYDVIRGWNQFPTYLDSNKGYWILLNPNATSLAKIKVESEGGVTISNREQDLSMIKNISENSWHLLGNSYDLEYSEAYSSNRDGCTLLIFNYDALTLAWNSSEKIFANSGFWARQECE